MDKLFNSGFINLFKAFRAKLSNINSCKLFSCCVAELSCFAQKLKGYWENALFVMLNKYPIVFIFTFIHGNASLKLLGKNAEKLFNILFCAALVNDYSGFANLRGIGSGNLCGRTRVTDLLGIKAGDCF